MYRGRSINIRFADKSDFPFLSGWAGSEDNCRFLYGSQIAARGDEEKKLEEILFGGTFFPDHFYFIIEDKKKNRIGYAHMHSIDWKNRHLINDWIICDRGLRGKKYGKEALVLLAKIIFSQLNMNKMSGKVYGFNAVSRHINEKAEKYGAICEGVLRRHVYRRGQFHDMYIYSTLKSAYEKFEKSGGIDLLAREGVL